MSPIDPDLLYVALEKVDTRSFELYSQAVCAQVLGSTFKPLGGMHDGGADGFIDDGDLFEQTNKATRFFQASKQVDAAAKIRGTVKRLTKYGREVRALYYASANVVKDIDKLQLALSDELDARIMIYDANFFAAHLNDTPQLQAAFETHLSPATAFLKSLAAPSFPNNVPIQNATAVCAFLGQELERRKGTVRTLEAVCDSLIFWALEGTDPEKELFLSQDEITEKVLKVIPSAKKFFRGQVGHRLEQLRKKSDGERQVNYHKKENGYCLPYSTRESIRKSTLADERLRTDFNSSIKNRIASCPVSISGDVTELIVDIVHQTLEGVFSTQGASAARHFLEPDESASDLDARSIVEVAMEKLATSSVSKDLRSDVEQSIRFVLRGVFYSSEPAERQYCSRLSRTYVLLFTLRNTPEVIEYFNTMAGSFELSVASDLVIRAMSEYYLPEEDQMANNALRIIKGSGSKLYLSEATLEEIHSHIWASDREYNNSYRDVEAHMTVDLASQIDRILIRAYYYSKLEKRHKNYPTEWGVFLSNFLTYRSMNGPTSAASMKSLRDTLCNRFGFEYLPREEMEKGVNGEELEKLSNEIYRRRNGANGRDMKRAENDALQILRIHQLRKKEDRKAGNPYGYKSWWLTQETISAVAAKVVFSDRRHMNFVMRPEFLVNYIAYNPTTAEVRQSLDTIFPSMHGVRLADRIDGNTLNKVIEKLREASSQDSARATALLSEYSDALKQRRLAEFVHKF